MLNLAGRLRGGKEGSSHDSSEPIFIPPHYCILRFVIVPKPIPEKEGWLWHMAGKAKMSEKEMVEWLEEGKSWFFVR
jgi:hypothetical protein